MQMELFPVPAPNVRVMDALMDRAIKRRNRVPVRVPLDVLRVSITEFGDMAIGGDKDALADRKFSECGHEFIEDIRTNGILQPLEVSVDHERGGVSLWNGHHRFFLAEEIGLEHPIPVALEVDWYAWDDLPASWADQDSPYQHERLF